MSGQSTETGDLRERVLALAAQCPLDPDTPHECAVLIAAHDLPVALGLTLLPGQGGA